ncbi:MAG: polysaccharide biosynthesis protein [bacterium]|nr:polysaccharide biosynthesis protein [bacterium]MDZ4284644.1 polysaccharide biosynthesis protein [Patescibacteria group bacterium]
MSDPASFIRGKKILVTGGTGSIGRVIVNQLLSFDPAVVRIFSRDAIKQIEVEDAFARDRRLRYILGDIRDRDRLMSACEDVDIIFHAAAFKYVPQGEYNPFEAVQTNVIGTQHVVSAALNTPTITHTVMISTDKAVAPTSTMGASKLLAERLITAAHYIQGKRGKIFTTVRFGNVLGTVGSVLPLFHEQARAGALTVTHPDMTRFFMTIPDAVELVFEALMRARGGDIFVLKMPALKIADLAEVCAERFTSPPARVVYGVIRPGEKIHEGLLTEDEARTALETERHFIIVPQIATADVAADQYTYAGALPRTSETYLTRAVAPLGKDDISALLDRAGW